MSFSVVIGSVVALGASLLTAGVAVETVRNPASRRPARLVPRLALIVGYVLYTVTIFSDFRPSWLLIAAAALVGIGAIGQLVHVVQQRRHRTPATHEPAGNAPRS